MATRAELNRLLTRLYDALADVQTAANELENLVEASDGPVLYPGEREQLQFLLAQVYDYGDIFAVDLAHELP